MPKWLVRLKVEKFDLDDLPKLCSPELTVTEENGSYYLESSEFSSLTSLDEVRELGIDFIKMINGAAKISINNFQDISEDGIVCIDDKGNRVSSVKYGKVSFIGRPQLKVNAVVIKSNGTQVLNNKPTYNYLESLICLQKKHKPVKDALHFFGKNTWPDLYKTYELIRDDIGGKRTIIKNGWVSEKILGLFTGTAQSREVLGDNARHASKKFRPPDQPMSFSEAKSLIKGLLMNWLHTKR